MKLLPLFAATILLSALPAESAVKSWVGSTGGGANGNWSNGANWSGGGAPVDGDSLSLNGSGGPGGTDTPFSTTNIFDLPSGITLSGINFSGYNFNISTSANRNNSFKLNGDINKTAGGSSIIYAKVELLKDITVHNDGNALTFYISDISGNYGITKTGTGALAIRNASTFSGGITLNGGILSAVGTNGGALATQFGTGALTVNSGTVSLNGAGTTVTGLKGTGGLIEIGGNTNRVFTINTANTTGDAYAGVIQNGTGTGILSVIKDGIGKQTLTGTSTYTGATTVSNGTLLINGKLGDTAVTVSAPGTLGGHGGEIGGAVTVSGTGSLSFSLTDPDTTGLTLGNNLSLSANSNLKLTLDSAVNLNDVFTLLQITGSRTGQFATINGAAFGIGNTFSLTYGGGSYDFAMTYGANSIIATVIAVPEPSTALLLGATCGGLLWVRSRSRRKG